MGAVVLTVAFVVATLAFTVTGLGCLAAGLTPLGLASFTFALGCWLMACVSASRVVRS